MAVNNTLVKQEERKQLPFSVAIQGKGYQNLINNTLRDPAVANRFIASVTSAVSANAELQKCEAGSILSAALLGESLKLSPSPQLGQYYMVPFKQKEKLDKQGNVIQPETTKAQFILGYKGYIQLAIRSGQYRKLNVLPIKQGELMGYDPLEETIRVRMVQDEIQREQLPTIGYYAFFEYINGFKKAIYWSREKMLAHADRYSAAFSAYGTTGRYPKVSYDDYAAGKYDPKDEWKYSSFWYKDFDGMACKTLLRQLISKWGVMSIDLQTAIEKDMAVINSNGAAEYVESVPAVQDVPEEAPEPAPDPVQPPPPDPDVIDIMDA